MDTWCKDMGLGPVEEQFLGVHEEDLVSGAKREPVEIYQMKKFCI